MYMYCNSLLHGHSCNIGYLYPTSEVCHLGCFHLRCPYTWPILSSHLYTFQIVSLIWPMGHEYVYLMIYTSIFLFSGGMLVYCYHLCTTDFSHWGMPPEGTHIAGLYINVINIFGWNCIILTDYSVKPFSCVP